MLSPEFTHGGGHWSEEDAFHLELSQRGAVHAKGHRRHVLSNTVTCRRRRSPATRQGEPWSPPLDHDGPEAPRCWAPPQGATLQAATPQAPTMGSRAASHQAPTVGKPACAAAAIDACTTIRAPRDKPPNGAMMSCEGR